MRAGLSEYLVVVKNYLRQTFKCGQTNRAKPRLSRVEDREGPRRKENRWTSYKETTRRPRQNALDIAETKSKKN